MSAEDRDDKDPLQSLIAEILEAENRGEAVDRDALIEEHQEHADSLREFFASHDQMKLAAEVDPPTLPPADSSLEDPTILPNATDEYTTIPPTEPALPNDVPSIGDKVRYFGDYELLEEIARGGMGVVYKARQKNLNRTVALKMILAGQFAGEEDVQRFYTEAEAAASLDHPGIVPIFEIGEHAGQHYFSMGYIEGESLALKVADGPLPPREAAELLKKICDAMAYAHERGVIHRDLKPANILIDSGGQPKVTDFGLAKKTEADSGLTGTGQILGTPAYMPPEQASGKTVGPLADIYSLGAILYCLLTGRPPFQAASPMDTLLSVLDKEPVPPRQLNPSVPIDLETICLKCLRKDSEKRYTTSSDLAEELDRFVKGKPIHARPVGQIERGWRWCKRNPTLSATGVIAALLLLTIGIGSPIVAWQQSNLRGQIQVEKDQAESELQRAEKLVYASQISSAQRQWESRNTSGAWESLNATQRGLRGWEYDYLFTALRGAQPTLEASEAVATVAVSPNGKLIAVGGQGGAVQLWDVVLGKQIYLFSRDDNGRSPIRVFFCADGTRLLGLDPFDGFFSVRDVSSGMEISNVKLLSREKREFIRSAAVSSDGKLLAVGGGKLVNEYEDLGRHHRGMISVWDVATGKPIHPYLGRSREVVGCVAFSPDVKRIVSGGQDGLFLWDLATGQETLTFENGARITEVAFSADGERLIGSRYSGTVAIWDVSTGKQLHQIPGGGTTVRALAFSPDGTCVFTAYDRDDEIKVWDVTKKIWIIATGTEKLNLEYGGTCGIVFSPDGTLIASAGKSRTVKIWELETGREVFSGQGHTDAVTSLAFSSDGQRLISGSADGSVKTWEFSRSRDYSLLSGHRGPVGNLAFSPDGMRLASAGQDGYARIWDLASGEQISFNKYSLGIPVVSFVDGGNQIVGGTYRIASWDPAISPWESTNTDAQKPAPLQIPEPYVCVAVSPTGDRIVAAPFWTQPTAGRRILAIEREKGRQIYAKELPDRFLTSVFSPDGEQIALAYDSFVEIRDFASGSVALTMEACRPPVAFSHDGKWIATGYGVAGDSVQVADVKDGQRKTLLVGHTDAIACLAFSPSGDRIVSGSNDKTLKVWDLHSGQETITLGGHSSGVTSVMFRPGGSLIVSGDADGNIRLWNATHAFVQQSRPGDVWIGRWEQMHVVENKSREFLLSVSRDDEDYVAEIENLRNITITSIDNTSMQLTWPSLNADGTPSLLKMTLHLSGSRLLEGSFEMPGKGESRLEGNRKSYGYGRSLSKQGESENRVEKTRIPLRLRRDPVHAPSVGQRRNPFDDMKEPQSDDQPSKKQNPFDTPSVKVRRNPFDDPQDRPVP